MSSGDSRSRLGFIPSLFSWEFLFLQVIFLGLVAVMLETPTGALSGSIALEQKDFGLYSYSLKENKVYALINGPRGGPQLERGVWVNNDGTFQFDGLPIGEYMLTVRAPGFSHELVKGLYIEDGKVSRIPKPVKLSLLSPSVNIASNSRVFTSKDKPNFWVNATGAAEATVKVYKQDLLALTKPDVAKKWGVTLSNDMSLYVDSANKFESPFGAGQAPVETFTRKLQQDNTDSAHAEFQFDRTLPPGDYFTIAEVRDIFGKSGARALTWFSVSDIGLVVKNCPTETVVRAIDLNTLKAAQGVNLTLFERPENAALTPRAKGVTGADGIVHIALPDSLKGQLNYNLMLIGNKGDHRAYGGTNYYRSDNDVHKTYFYTDRPVYRLGQTVLFKGMSRLMKDNGLSNAGAGQPLTITVEDPDNNAIKTIELKTNKYGTFNGLIEIPENGKTGGYQVQIAYEDGNTSYQSFEVAQYKKPEYQVEVEAITKRVIAGDKARAKVRATYYFGGPVANAQVKYSIYSSNDWTTRWKLDNRPEYYGFFDGWDDGDYESSSGDFISEGWAVTDANGEAIIEYETKVPEKPSVGPYGADFQDKKIRVEAEVTDISRMSVVSSGSLFQSSGEFVVLVDPSTYIVKAGETIPVDVKAIDYDSKPVANKDIEIQVVRFPYDRIRESYRPQEIILTQSVKTDAQGKAHLGCGIGQQLPADSYYIIARARDGSGHTVLDSTSVWVAEGNADFFLSQKEAERMPLTVKMNKKVYRPGEKARAIITGPFTGKEGMEALVGVEGSKLHELKVVPITSSAQLVEIDVKPEYCPNFYLNVSMVGHKRQYYSQEEMVKVSPDNHFLAISIDTDKDKYKPGEEATYTITAKTADGKPAKGVELSLGVVDESIYAIRAETAEDIRKFFYSQISNWVSTFCSFPEQYSGGPDKLEPRVRKDFKDTAAWFPNLETDDQGKAVVKFKLPDNLTTWRATVRGINLQSEVGSQVEKVISTQDVIARLALPRFFSLADEGLVTGIVHNYTDKPQHVKMTLAISGGLSTTMALAQSVTIDPDGAKRVSWPVKADRIGETTIKLTAVGDTAADALERKIDIKPLGTPVVLTTAGVMSRDEMEKTIELPEVADVTPGTLKREVSVASSTIGPVLGNFSALIDYPYGCTEQTMSRLMPSVVAMQLNKKLGVPLSAKDKAKFEIVYKEGMDKLTSYQHGDGGWGWWPTDESQPYLTALVMEGMKLLKDSGYAVSNGMMDSAIKWGDKSSASLIAQLTDAKRVRDEADAYISRGRETDMAYMLYAQSLWNQKKAGKNQMAAMNYLRDNLNTLNAEGIAYLARAANNNGERELATLAVNRMMEIANTNDATTGATIDWEYTDKMAKAIGDKHSWYNSYRFTPEETTALCLSAIVEVKPEMTEATEKVKNWLLLTRGKDGWGTTKSTAQVFKALLAEELADAGQPKSVEAVGRGLACLVNGVSFSDTSKYGPERVAKLEALSKALSAVIKKEPGQRLYYSAQTRYYKDLSKVTSLNLPNSPSDLKISRKFYHLQSVANTSDGTIHIKSVPLDNGGQIKAGETVLMKIEVETPRAMPYVMVEAALPSGSEVVANDAKENAIEAENSKPGIVGDWEQVWWNHQDILDDKIVFFGSNLKPGKSEFTTLLRMELPGKVGVMPVNMEGMYTKNIKGLSNIDRLNIQE